MAWWKEYALSIIICALFCGIITHVVSDLRFKKLIRLVCGTFLAVTVLGPLSSVEIADPYIFDAEAFSPETYVEMGKQAALNVQAQCIKDACESYISNKANDFGAVVTAEVFLDEKLKPYFAEIYSHSDSDQQSTVQQILEEDLGITKENQVWIWNQEEEES